MAIYDSSAIRSTTLSRDTSRRRALRANVLEHDVLIIRNFIRRMHYDGDIQYRIIY